MSFYSSVSQLGMNTEGGGIKRAAVTSHISPKIHYKETREVEPQDIGHVCSLYEIEFMGEVVAIALGKARMDKPDVIYCPIYGVGDKGVNVDGGEKDVDKDVDEDNEPKEPIAKCQMGVIEAPATTAVVILGKASLLSKRGSAAAAATVTDYDVPLDVMGDILLYHFVTPEFLRSLHSRPETYHLPTITIRLKDEPHFNPSSTSCTTFNSCNSSNSLANADLKDLKVLKDLNKADAAAAAAEEADDIFDILVKRSEDVLRPSVKQIEESLESGVFRAPPPGFVRPPYLHEETHKVAKQKKQEYTESPRDSWIQKFMRNRDYAIVEVESNGDCFFATVRDAFASIGRITDVAALRSLVAKAATESMLREYIQIYTQFKQHDEQSKTELRELKSEIDNAKTDVKKANALIENYNKKVVVYKHQKKVNAGIMSEFKYMEQIKTLEDFRAFILTPNFWADAEVIALLEKELRFKAIILGEESFIDGSRDSVMQCGGGWSKAERIEPEFYVITTYSGNHYRLVSYLGARIFTFREIPYDIKTLIMHKCMERNAGDYAKIPEFGEWKSRFTNPTHEEMTDEEKTIEDSAKNGEPASYDKTIVFKFYENSPTKPQPGKGNGEEIPANKVLVFKELAVISDWRRMLDDSWVQEGGLFRLENRHWLSVEHYMLGAQFKKGWPDIFAAFSVESKTPISADLKEARKAVAHNKKTGSSFPGFAVKGVAPDIDFQTTTGLDGILRLGRETTERERAVREKFIQNPQLMKVLILTGEAHLMHFIRAHPAKTDEILMRIRSEAR